MKQGILRNLRYQGHNQLQMVGLTLVTILLLALFAAFTAPIDRIGQVVIAGFAAYIPTSCVLWGVTPSLSFYTVIMPYLLSMGSTRKAVFLVNQIYKVAFALFSGLVFYLVNMVGGEYSVFTGFSASFTLFATIIFLGSMAEVAGALSYRAGKWGMIFYIAAIVAVCLVVGVAFGLSAASGGEMARMMFDLAAAMKGFPITLFSLGGIVGGALFSGACWFIVRRVAIK